MSENKKHLQRHTDNRLPLSGDNGDVRELTTEDIGQFRPMSEMFPDIVDAFERLRGQRGPQKAPVKERIGLRLDSEIIAYFRQTGPGWQTRINDILAGHVKGGRK